MNEQSRQGGGSHPTTRLQGCVLAVGASDAVGRGGIQGDMKTLTALGVFSATAITSVIADQARHDDGVAPIDVPAQTVAAQMGCVLDDIGADVIKTGWLRNAEIIGAVADQIEAKAGAAALVVDPDMLAPDGKALLDAAATQALKARLLVRATVLTPSIGEANILTGMSIDNIDDMVQAATMLTTLGPPIIYLKGREIAGDVVSDVLVVDGEPRVLEAPRLHAPRTTGAGTALAAAIAGGLARGVPIEDAVELARLHVREALIAALGTGDANPLDHSYAFGRVKGAPPRWLGQGGDDEC